MTGLAFALWVATLTLAAPPPKPARPPTFAERRAACVLDPLCGGAGWCTPGRPTDELKCNAGSDRDCSSTDECTDHGRCSYDAKTRRCVLEPKTSCAQTLACKLQGACARGETDDHLPACYADSEVDCQAARDCAVAGRCTLDGYRCGWRAEDCARSQNCAQGGYCAQPRKFGACGASPDGCRSSKRCAFGGKCTYSAKIEGCISAPEDCATTTVCRELGWCEGVPRGVPSCPGDGCYLCGATHCEDAPPCRLWGACTPYLGRCVVQAPTAPGCTLHAVTGLKAEASSTRAPDEFGEYDAARMVDRDSRTAWTAAPGDGKGVVLRFRLPTPRRVARITVRNTFELLDPLRGRLLEQFGWLASAVVHVGERVEIFYGGDALRTYGTAYPVEVPPTLTDEVRLEITLVTPSLRYPEPAITEVRIEACDP